MTLVSPSPSPSPSPYHYDAGNRLKFDDCQTNTIAAENKKQANYKVMNHRASCCDVNNASDRQAFQTRHRNLIAWNGYGGINGCTVDDDSSSRIDPNGMTHPRCRQQLPNRIFQAVPKLYRGTVLPSLESRIQNGADTSYFRECDRIDEKMWNVFNPAINKVDTRNIVQDWTWGGDNSRDIARSDEFLKSIGYMNDGRIWHRNQNTQ